MTVLKLYGKAVGALGATPFPTDLLTEAVL